MKLSGKQRRHLRALGHGLEPVVLVGKDGVTDGLVAATVAALATHELVKIKVGGNTPEDRHAVAGGLAARAEAELVQVLGNTVLLYKPDPDEPKIKLPPEPAMIKIILGNKNYSSWSMRPWLALHATGAAFDEVVVPLDQPDTAERIAAFSPAGRVPILRDADLAIWDSLAICEYVAELFPAAELWPRDAGQRARARAISAEMHSGFAALRTAMPMNIRADLAGRVPVSADVAADIARIRAIWHDARARASGGDFLFGRFSIADCMFAPVVTRFRTYGVALDGAEAEYAAAIWAHPSVVEWVNAARAESWTLPKYDR